MCKKLSQNEEQIIKSLFGPLFPKTVQFDLNSTDPLDSVSPHTLKDIIFILSMICRKKGWDQTGICLSIGAEQLEAMIEEDSLTQSISNLKENLKDNVHVLKKRY